MGAAEEQYDKIDLDFMSAYFLVCAFIIFIAH
jgi:hypothetical protein